MIVQPQYLEQTLWTIAKRAADLAGFEIAPHGVALLRPFIRSGYEKLLTEEAWNDKDRAIEAQMNLNRFVEQMAEEAKQQGLSMLDAQTFTKTRDRMCPLWPYC